MHIYYNLASIPLLRLLMNTNKWESIFRYNAKYIHYKLATMSALGLFDEYIEINKILM